MKVKKKRLAARVAGRELPVEVDGARPDVGGAATALGCTEPSLGVALPSLAEDALYGLAGDVVRTIEPHTEADPAALLFQFLGAFGNQIGRRPHFVAEADRHFTNIFVVLVGLSSKGRKGSSWGQVSRLFRTIAPVWTAKKVASGMSSGEGVIWLVRDAIHKTMPLKQKGRVVGYQDVIEDPGVKDKRALMLESEFAQTLRVLAREGNTLSPVLRSAWDRGDLQTITKNTPARATGAHISIIAHITKQELLRYLDATESANGFGNRFIWVFVKRSKVLPEGGRLRDQDLAPLVARLKAAMKFAKEQGALERDAEARDLWAQVYPELSEGRPGLLGSVIARAEAQVMRLATIYALLDRSPEIRLAHLRAGLAAWRYAEASARFIFGDALGEPLADEIRDMLRSKPEGMTRTEIRDRFSRHQTSDAIDRALGTLHENGLAQPSTIATGGRPSERWTATKATKATNPLIPTKHHLSLSSLPSPALAPSLSNDHTKLRARSRLGVATK